MVNQSDYTERSEKERVVVNQTIPNILNNLKEEYTIQYYTTPIDSMDIYDFYIMILKDGSTKKRIIGEVKVRDAHYPDLLLEKKKYNSLKKKAEETGATIMYINTTPEGTFIFNLSKIINSDIKWIKEDHWKSTTDKSLGKISKSIIYIPIEKAKKTTLTTSEVNIKWKQQKANLSFIKEDRKNQSRLCLFQDVLKINNQL